LWCKCTPTYWIPQTFKLFFKISLFHDYSLPLQIILVPMSHKAGFINIIGNPNVGNRPL